MTHGPCQPFRHLLGAYVDGQLEPATVLAIEEHLEQCAECRERVGFQRAVGISVKRAVRAESLPMGARSRFAAALEAACVEQGKQDQQDQQDQQHERDQQAQSEAGRSVATFVPIRARHIIRSAVPLTAAAALALLWGASAQGPLTRAAISSAAANASSKELLEELVHEHSLPLPPERTDPKDMRDFERYVGVPVRPRISEKSPGARFVGGRVLPMHQERAAMLQYEVGSGADTKRVSVLVYDPRRIQVGSSDLASQTVGTAEVRVGRERGYSVAVGQRDGVGYAAASEIDSAQLVRFVNDD